MLVANYEINDGPVTDRVDVKIMEFSRIGFCQDELPKFRPFRFRLIFPVIARNESVPGISLNRELEIRRPDFPIDDPAKLECRDMIMESAIMLALNAEQ